MKMQSNFRFRIIVCISFILASVFMLKTPLIPSNCNPKENVKFQNAIDRQLWWKKVVGNPATPAQQKIASKVIQKQIKESGSGLYRDAGINGWADLGPSNIGGRIRAIAIHPTNTSTLFIGGVSGGIWKSTNSGNSWNLVTSAPLSYPVTSLTYDPSNSSIMYASTGERNGGQVAGIGILKSSDGGNTWNQLPFPDSTFQFSSKIVVNPLNSNILYTSGSNQNNNGNLIGVIFRSNDGGNTWFELWQENIAPLSSHIYDFEINPQDTSELIIGTSLQVLFSSNSGSTWSSLMGATSPFITTPANFTGNRCEVAYCQSNPNNIYVLRFLIGATNNRTELWRSVNGGGLWTLLDGTSGGDEDSNILDTQGDYDNTLWVDPSNCSRAIMGGINLWKWNTNNTKTRISEWPDDIGGNQLGDNNSVHADQHIIIPDPNYNGSTNNRVYIGNDGGIYKSDNIWSATTGTGWASLVSNMNISQIYTFDISKTGDTLIAGSQDNSYFTQRNANTNSQNWTVYSTGDGGFGAIKKSNPEIIYTSTQRGQYYKSSNGGDSFCEMLSLNNRDFGIPNCGNFSQQIDNPVFIAPFEMDPNDEQTIYAGGRRLWQSTNEGSSWSTISSPQNTSGPNGPIFQSISTIEIAKGDGNLIFLGYEGGLIYRTTNGGTNWTQQDVGTMPNEYVTDIAINPNNHNEVMVTFGGGYDNDVVWYSQDAGQSWSNRSPSFDIKVSTITWHPLYTNWVYLGTDLGIFASENDGSNWNITPLYDNSEGPVFTLVTELRWQGNGSNSHPYYLAASTYGRGVWRTKAPIRNKYYVDKNCDPCGTGSFSRPYATFRNAVDAAGHGTEIIILTGSEYNEVPSSILLKRRIKVTLANTASSSFIIK